MSRPTTAKEHPSMRATLSTISAVALLAAGAGPAAARPADSPVRQGPSPSHQVLVPSVGEQHRYMGSDAKPVPAAPAQVVHVGRAQIADGGIDWADVGIGAGLAAALLASAAGVTAVRRPQRMRLR
jgi:hypothetical protein